MGSKTQDKNNVVKFQSSTNKKNKSNANPLMLGTFIILVITIISFVLVPALTGVSEARGAVEFGRFGNKVIRFVQGNYFAQQVEWAKEMYSNYFSTSDAGQLELIREMVWRYAYDQTLTHYAVIYLMEKSGFFVTDKRIDRTIAKSFTIDGQFDSERYRNISASQKQSMRKEINENLIIQTYQTDIYYGQFINEKEVSFLQNLAETERDFSYIIFSFEDFPIEQVKKYGRDNAELFERIKLSRITVEEKKEAEEITEKFVSKTNSFEELARAYSKDAYAQDGGRVGWQYNYAMADMFDKDIVAAIFSHKSGEITEPIETPYGSWVIYYIEEQAKEGDFEDSDFLSEVRYYLESNEAGVIEDYLENRAKVFIRECNEYNFTSAAFNFSKEIKTTGYFPINYGSVPFIKGNIAYTVEDLGMAGAGTSQDFYTACFSLKHQGDISEPVILDRAVAVFQLNDEKPVAEKPADYEVKNFIFKANQAFFETMIKDSPLFVDKFDEGYNKLFQQQ